MLAVSPDRAAQVPPLFGREQVITLLREMTGAARLVTVKGPGGVGKTAVAQAVLAGSAIAVRMADLSTLAEPALVPHAVARALRVQDQLHLPLLDSIAASVGNRAELLFLDTCDHLATGCAPIVSRLLAACPNLRVLATSRIALGLPSENVVDLPPLHPDAAVALLLHVLHPPGRPSARSAQPAASIAAAGTYEAARGELELLCTRLGHLPLGIKLAGLRFRDQPLAVARGVLDTQAGLLDLGPAGPDPSPMPGRHRTLRTAIGWSHQTCGANERLLWARLSVFHIAFTEASAIAACADTRLPRAEVSKALAGLLRASVVMRPASTYSMLAPYRAFGAEALSALGEHPG